MTNTTIGVYEQWDNCKMVVKIGNQPSATYNNLKLDEMVRFISSHQELLTVFTNSTKIYDILKSKVDYYNVELQFRVS